jgi:polyhydroxyalkanoate synthase
MWASAQAATNSFGLLPMEVLQSAFWSLDPSRTVAKFEKFATLEPGSPAAAGFVALEDWANDGPPMGESAAREMFGGFFAADLPGAGAWMVGGGAVSPGALPCPLLSIVSTSDRIVPAATSVRTGDRLELALGHVGMVIGGRARESLWEPLAAWLSQDRLG